MTDGLANQRNATDRKTGETYTQIKCFVCESWFRFGQHIYDGKRIPQYDIMICDVCYKSNWDGFTEEKSVKIENHLKRQNLPVPARNQKGWLPRP